MLWLTPSFVPALVADLHHLDGLGEREGDRLLGQDPLHVRPLRRLADDLELLIGWVRDVDDLHFGVVEELLPRVVHLPDAVLLGRRPGVLRRPGGDRDGAETGLVVGRKVDVAHDEAGADAPDPVVGLVREVRPGVEVEVGHRSS